MQIPNTLFGRLLEAYGVKTAPQLAERVGKKLPTVKSWRIRDSVPIPVLLIAAKDSGCSLDWLKYGPPHQKHPARFSREIDRARQRDAFAERLHDAPGEAAAVEEEVDDFSNRLSYKPLGQRQLRLNEAANAPPSTPTPGLGVFPLLGEADSVSRGALLAPQEVSEQRPLVLPVSFPTSNVLRQYQVIPTFTIPVRAGRSARNAAATGTTDPAGYVAFDRSWMRQTFGRDGAGFMSVNVAGNSMHPTLSDGDTIIVDTFVDRVDASGIYVIRIGVDTLVKRVQRKLDGSLVVKSDNEAYEPETLIPERARDLQVIGRMVWPRVR